MSLGCDASTMVGTDCDSFWYYTWPPCWSNSRTQWESICKNLPAETGGGADTTCGVGGCGQDYFLGIPLTGAAVQDALQTGKWVFPVVVIGIGLVFLLKKK